MKTKKTKIFITLGLLSLTLFSIFPARGCRYYAGAPNSPLEASTSAISKIKGTLFVPHGIGK
jgi:hypothetical protein